MSAVLDDSLDAMEVEERAALLAAIDEGIAEYRSGVPGIPAAQALAELRAARTGRLPHIAKAPRGRPSGG